jgi:D-alanyl-D-alanine dipeptidase
MIHSLKLDGRLLELANLEAIDDTIKFDIRYARADNFMGKSVYTQARAFLLKHVAEDLLNVHLSLRPHGLGLLIFDGYRPWKVTKIFWDESKEELQKFLANPESGSSHNRGCAVDLSMYRLSTGEAVMMPSDFDEMNEKAYADYAGGTPDARRLRDLLKTKMLENNFTGIKYEWWHFNHITNASWPLMDYTFEEILEAEKKPHPFLKK